MFINGPKYELQFIHNLHLNYLRATSITNEMQIHGKNFTLKMYLVRSKTTLVKTVAEIIVNFMDYNFYRLQKSH